MRFLKENALFFAIAIPGSFVAAVTLLYLIALPVFLVTTGYRPDEILRF